MEYPRYRIFDIELLTYKTDDVYLDKNGLIYTFDLILVPDQSRYIIEQCARIKDCTRTELDPTGAWIYEGDILQTTIPSREAKRINWRDKREVTAWVYFDYCDLRLKVENGIDRRYLCLSDIDCHNFEGSKYGNEWILVNFNESTCKHRTFVIGNIHQGINEKIIEQIKEQKLADKIKIKGVK